MHFLLDSSHKSNDDQDSARCDVKFVELKFGACIGRNLGARGKTFTPNIFSCLTTF